MSNSATEERRLQALAALRVLDRPPEERFARIVRLTQQLFDVPTAVVSLIDEHRQYNLASVGQAPSEMPREDSFCEYTIRTDEPFVVADTLLDARFQDNAMVKGGMRFYAGQPVSAPSGINVGALCIAADEPREITPQQLAILRELADFVEAELARSDEIDRAGELQRRLLPKSVPQIPGYDLAGVCLAADVVGGDFYDWYFVQDQLQVVVADVMGKGVSAALIGAGLRALMHGASQFNPLARTVDRVAYSLTDDLSDTGSFATMFVVRIDPERHTLTWVDVGHGIAGLVTADGAAHQLVSAGLPFGVPGADTWEEHTVDLEPGDTFICLSDGMLDLFPDIDAAREAARETIVKYGSSAQEIIDVIAWYAREHEATDDVTAVVIRRVAD